MMYNNYKHQGLTLPEWQAKLKFQYSLGELYLLAKEGKDFETL